LEDPVLTAFSPTKLNVLTMAGLQWYSAWANKHPSPWFVAPAPPDPRLLWSASELIGGGMIVGGAAHAGRNSFVALAISDGQLFVNRNANGRWTGFQPVIGEHPGSEWIFRSPIFLPALAAHGGG
jgi:hypothetical protein